MEMLANISKRKYSVAITEGDVLETFTHSLEYLFRERENDYEYIYALYEIADSVLDLKLGESMYFKPNRDNEIAKGLIVRVN